MLPRIEIFLGVLHRWLLDTAETHARDHPLWMKDVRIYLPNLRLVRGLRERVMLGAQKHGYALVMPHIEALGDIDLHEDEMAEDVLSDAVDFELLPALHETERILILFRLIEKWLQTRTGSFRGKASFEVATHHAFELANSLAKLMDELDIQGIAVEEIDRIIPENLAEHWQMSRDFLQIVKEAFPKICQERGKISAKKRQMLCLHRLREDLQKRQPTTPVVIAGSTGSIPATADLMEVVTSLPQGLLVLPGLDMYMPEETWQSLENDVSHPQHGLQGILTRLGLKRQQVPEWGIGEDIAPSKSARGPLLSAALYPQGFFGRWSDEGHSAIFSYMEGR